MILNNHCHSGFRITNRLLNTAAKSEVGGGLPFLIYLKEITGYLREKIKTAYIC